MPNRKSHRSDTANASPGSAPYPRSGPSVKASITPSRRWLGLPQHQPPARLSRRTSSRVCGLHLLNFDQGMVVRCVCQNTASFAMDSIDRCGPTGAIWPACSAPWWPSRPASSGSGRGAAVSSLSSRSATRRKPPGLSLVGMVNRVAVRLSRLAPHAAVFTAAVWLVLEAFVVERGAGRADRAACHQAAKDAARYAPYEIAAALRSVRRPSHSPRAPAR